jgi:hypothetical protein
MNEAAIVPFAFTDTNPKFREEDFFRPLERVERLRQIFLGTACFLLSWHILRFGDINFTLSDFLFLCCLLILLVRKNLNLMALQSMTAQWCVALAMMLGGLLIGSVFNGDPLRWANIASQYLFGFLFLPMILMSEDREWIRKCLLYFVLGVAASELIALSVANFLPFSQAQALLGPSVVAGNGRVGGLVSDANLNGAIISFSMIVLYNAHHHGLIRNFFAFLVGAVLIWALLATASFTAFAATGIATMLYFVCSNMGRFFKFGIPLLIFGVAYIALGLPLPEAFSERVLGAVLHGDLSQAGTFTQRSALIAEAWKMSKDTLFVGLGVDEFRVASSYGLPVHQWWMLLLTEGGLLSVSGLFAIFAVLCAMSIKAISWHREDGAMALALLVILVIFSTSMPHMYNRLWIAPIMLALAATFAHSRRPVDDERQDDYVDDEDVSETFLQGTPA